ncbi:MAG: hypothetical protein ACQESR_06445 [Planctomycetota bacterium]
MIRIVATADQIRQLEQATDGIELVDENGNRLGIVEVLDCPNTSAAGGDMEQLATRDFPHQQGRAVRRTDLALFRTSTCGILHLSEWPREWSTLSKRLLNLMI